MSADLARPRLCVSKCLGFAACRWNGTAVQDDFVENLKGYVDFVAVCPEAEIGLGVPRAPIRIVRKQGSAVRLVQPATGRDVSGKMKAFAKKFLASLDKVDGFILKNRSPSCGLGNVKVYPSARSSASVARTHGFFGAEVVERFAGLPIETEASLTNCRIRERFLVRIFILAALRRIKKKGGRIL
jgi:uncharacterized protein YbbK (DUF523 family)